MQCIVPELSPILHYSDDAEMEETLYKQVKRLKRFVAGCPDEWVPRSKMAVSPCSRCVAWVRTLREQNESMSLI